jgi:hypothetical protein
MGRSLKSASMSRPSPRRLAAGFALLASLPLCGCVVGTVAGAAAGVAATTVKTGVKVTGAAVGATANATGAVVHTATGGH